ncbi:hypothetical protein KCP77_17060 [Salmonella enterica subsp. enterica]|nr:hypothetical protein KCP77_17060 [Salmonella enterica subsp. enterica]
MPPSGNGRSHISKSPYLCTGSQLKYGGEGIDSLRRSAKPPQASSSVQLAAPLFAHPGLPSSGL